MLTEKKFWRDWKRKVMRTIDDLLVYLKEKEKLLGKNGIVPNPIFDNILNRNAFVILYGAGALGHAVYDILVKNGIIPQYFCSGLKWGYVDPLTGIKVIDKGELTAYSSGTVILSIGDTASKEEKDEIRKRLFAIGYGENQIINHSELEEKVSPSFLLGHAQEISEVYALLSDEESRRVYLEKLEYMVDYMPVGFESFHAMYTDRDIIDFGEQEVIIDAGAYNGDSALMFRDKAGTSAEIYSFEPDALNYDALKNQVCSDRKIYPEKLGLWKCKDILYFSDEGNGSSHIAGEGNIAIQVTDLDSYCSKKGIIPTYIKMDIEGTEAEALQGAQENIQKNRPKLAICLYHKPKDIFELPMLVHKLNPAYKLYIRHYSDSQTDTLLYAI